MLYPWLSKAIGFPLLGYILNSLYFGLIAAGILISAVFFFRQMARTGYPENRLRAFVVSSAILIFPLGIISSRAANIFYFPPDQWTVAFFIHQFFEGPHQTFHASLILPFIFLMMLGQAFQFQKMHLMDSLFLYVPLGHAVARCGCLLVGCCWGHPVSMSILNQTICFKNPVPLYEIIGNILLFLFLKTRYQRIYEAAPPKGPGGTVAAFYLMGYGGFRMLLETLRAEKIIGMGMTLAQWSMMGFILAGLVLLVVIRVKFIAAERKPDRRPEKNRATALAGFVISLAVVAGGAAWLLGQKIIPWPFHGADTVGETYGRILVYLPVAGFSVLSLLWIRDPQKPVWDFFKWKGFSAAFSLGIALSGAYSLYLFSSHEFAYKGLSFVPPALILGILNAVSEELLFRLVFFQLLTQAAGSRHRANLAQAMAYGLVHLFIGGPLFFLGAVGYGLVLGWITQTHKSILPAMICHFIADVGAVMLPLLIYGANGASIGSF